MVMYKAVDAKTGEVWGEHSDYDIAVDIAFEKMGGRLFLEDGRANWHFQEQFDYFQSLEGVEWDIDEYEALPETADDWDAEIENNNIDVYAFLNEMVSELCNTSEGLDFLNRFAKTHDIFK